MKTVEEVVAVGSGEINAFCLMKLPNAPTNFEKNNFTNSI
jgi:hypothetical protein